jgi:hypothetical protein
MRLPSTPAKGSRGVLFFPNHFLKKASAGLNDSLDGLNEGLDGLNEELDGLNEGLDGLDEDPMRVSMVRFG